MNQRPGSFTPVNVGALELPGRIVVSPMTRIRAGGVPFGDSEELAKVSGAKLIQVGTDHRLADPEPLEGMPEACEGGERTG